MKTLEIYLPIVLSVLIRFKAFEYPFGIFKRLVNSRSLSYGHLSKRLIFLHCALPFLMESKQVV